jgi:hypothetical protein
MECRSVGPPRPPSENPLLQYSITPLLHSSYRSSFAIFAVDFSKHIADLTHRRLGSNGIHDRRHQIALFLGDPLEPVQGGA